MDKYVGKRLDGRYEILEVIGVGGMAVVYRAFDNVDNRIVAIKILKEEYTGNDEFLRRFKNESKAIAVLSHPNIVKVFDVSFGDLIQYIVMEYIDGITLKQYIDRQGSLSWNDAVRFTLQILRGLQHAHDKGVVHRDVKPHNIMVLSDGTIKVTDFGIARFARSEQKTITDKAIGSVHYISPEQARGENTDDKADIYSVGVMLYEMITGKLPFEAESAVSVAIMQLQNDPKLPRDINGSIPLGLEQITMHAMQKDVARRYRSAAEMLCDLEEFKKNPAATFDYDYFIDDSPTKFISIDNEESKPADGEETAEKSPIIPILAGISVTFVVAIIILVLFFFKSGDKPDDIKCDDFVGMQYTEVVNNTEYNNRYQIEIVYEYSSDYEQGEVFKQNPASGKDIKEGGKVTLYVCLGSKKVEIPDVSGEPIIRAKKELESKGFIVVEKEEASDDVPEGNVIKTNPLAGSTIDAGSEVTVIVSSGLPDYPVDVPDLIGLTRAGAEKELERLNLKLGEVTEVNHFKTAGTVATQDPSPDSTKTVNEGSAINIGISRGYLLFDLPLNIPNDYNGDKVYISLWHEGTLFASSSLVDLKSANYKYTFSDLKITKSNIKNFDICISKSLSASATYETVMQIKLIDNDGKYEITKNSDSFEYDRVTGSNQPVSAQ